MIAVAVRQVVHSLARAFARGNLSRYLNEALRDKLRNENLRQLIQEYGAEHGPITEEELAEARAVFKAADEGWKEWQRQQRG